MSIESVIPPNHLILRHSLLLLLSIFPSIRLFSNESTIHIRCQSVSFSFKISPSSEHSGLIFFRTDWFDLLAVQRILLAMRKFQDIPYTILTHCPKSLLELIFGYSGMMLFPLWHTTAGDVYFSDTISFWEKAQESCYPSQKYLFLVCSLPVKKAEHWRIDGFELWCWRRLLRVPWTARRSSQPILKEISTEYSLEELMLKLKLQCFGHLM